MVKRIWIVMGLMSLLLLSACGGDTAEESAPTPFPESDVTDAEPTADNTSSSTSTDGEAGFTATVSGTVEMDVNGSGYFICSDELRSLGGPVYLEIQSDITASDPGVMIRFPLGTEPGTYPLIGSDEAMSPAEGQGMISFDGGRDGEDWRVGTGELTLETIPSANGEPIIGSFRAQLTSNDTEGTINLSGEFNFNAASFAFDEGLCTPEAQATATAERAAAQSAAESIDLPDVPSDLTGTTVTVSDVENGFTAEDVPMFTRGAICVGDEVQWSFQDDVTGEPILNINILIASDTTSGTYPVTSTPQDGSLVVTAILLEADTEDAVQFRRVTEGALRLDDVPTVAGDPFSGAFSLTITPDPMLSDAEATVTASGVFNIDTTDATLCQS
jgi:hypothetical protein